MVFNKMQRDLSIDYAKGIAIICVYLGHSILYYPDNLFPGPYWLWLRRLITSFNMPLFFFISGLLFGSSKKSNDVVLKDKVRRLVVPYLFTMAIVEISKLLLPTTMSANPVGGGIVDILKNVFLFGGDRWFVYVLFLIFCIAIPLRKVAKTLWVYMIIVLLFILAIFAPLPHDLFRLYDVVRYLPFFLIGVNLSQYYSSYKEISLKYLPALIVLFVITNMILQPWLWGIELFRRAFLPIIGTALIMAISFKMKALQDARSENYVVFKYIEYCGKYSLQFYLFTFAYPIIRYVVVFVLHFTNPFVILFTILILQLLAITIFVEITRRIKFLRLPMGY